MKAAICTGFKAGGVAAGLKPTGEKDLGLIFSEVPASVAGVFTRNKIKAAPVLLDMERVKSGVCQAIIVNSKNANCCTGEQGLRDAEKMTRTAAKELGISENLVLAASTGVIGAPLPIDKIIRAVPQLTGSLKAEGFLDLARAMMTTDTAPKWVTAEGDIDGNPFCVTGVAKGSGMIRPDMATLLCFLCTDVKADPQTLDELLHEAVDRSLNRITIDGDTSTNDTALLMANGQSGAAITCDAHKIKFQAVLDDVLLLLAKLLVKDGEGATKLVEVMVRGALSDEDASQVVDTIAHSPLVKTALFGEDANWGRILAAAGRAKVPVEPHKIDLFFNDVMMVKNGVGCGNEAEARATEVLKKAEFSILIDLNMGTGRASMFTCDFSIDYVKINADYRS